VSGRGGWRCFAAALALLIVTVFLAGRYLAAAYVSPEEEHFQLGQRLYATGTLSLEDEPTVFRPPGFPAFVAGVLHVRDAVAPSVDDLRAVALAHAGLLGIGALALFARASRTHATPVAFACGMLYALHPLSLLIARNISYYTLHIVCVSLATLALGEALRQDAARPRASWALAAGAAWGLTTLVRPLTLLLPPFVFLAARWQGGRGSGRAALRFTALFVVAMAAVIAPYTARNHRVAHRLVLVNAQDGFAVWALTATRNPAGDTSEWLSLWNRRGAAIYDRVTGGAPYSTARFHRDALALNDAFRAEARRNVRRNPLKYASNVVWNLVAFHRDHTHRWLALMGQVREGRGERFRVLVAQLVGWSILALALAGVARGLRDGDPEAPIVAALYAMFWAAHAFVILMSRYTYVRFPLVLVAFPLALRGIEKRPVAVAVLGALAAAAALLAW
jgi:hypothetical protein